MPSETWIFFFSYSFGFSLPPYCFMIIMWLLELGCGQSRRRGSRSWVHPHLSPGKAEALPTSLPADLCIVSLSRSWSQIPALVQEGGKLRGGSDQVACLSHQLSPGLWLFAALYKTGVLWAGQSDGGGDEGIVVRWEHTPVFLPGLGSP